jgi:hypothetical protein
MKQTAHFDCKRLADYKSEHVGCQRKSSKRGAAFGGSRTRDGAGFRGLRSILRMPRQRSREGNGAEFRNYRDDRGSPEGNKRSQKAVNLRSVKSGAQSRSDIER